jgi:hypothetical protein
MHLQHMVIITLAALLKQEIAAVLRHCLRFPTLLCYLMEEYPVTENACLCVDIKLILVDTQAKDKRQPVMLVYCVEVIGLMTPVQVDTPLV